jgi:hypothetical protein
MISTDAFLDEFEKIAARRGLKMIRDYVQGGNIDKAKTLAKTTGVLKTRGNNPVGSQVKMLSHEPTREGPTLLTASPDLGLAATHIPHPNGMTTPRLANLKEEVAKIDHPANVKILAKDHVEGLANPIHHSEYVHGTPLSKTKMSPDEKDAVRRHVNDLSEKAGREHGIALKDRHDSNIMVDEHGKGRLIDSLPERHGEGALTKPGKTISPHQGVKDVMSRMAEHGFERKKMGPAPKPEVARRPIPKGL